MRNSKTIIALAVMALAALPAAGADFPSASGSDNPPQPGAINYIEGAAFLDGNPLNNQSVGSVTLGPGQILSTGSGKVEILLTPGIFLRVGSNSSIKMISPDIEETQVEIDKGQAGIEVDQILPQNMVQIIDAGVTTQLMKTGYYEFNATQPEAMVFDGRAEVQLIPGKWETVKGNHEIALVLGSREKSHEFDTHPTSDDMYNWSRLRSQYLAQANNQIAGEYADQQGFNPGWYWDPYSLDYTYLGMDPFFSPFGWGFYPWGGFYGGWGFGGGYYGGGYCGGRGYGNRGNYGGRGVSGHSYMGNGHPGGGYQGVRAGNGFHGGLGGSSFHGGGFGGGGFHGGGFGGGGFHGGGGFGGGRR